MKSSVSQDMTLCNPKLTDVSEERGLTLNGLYGVMLQAESFMFRDGFVTGAIVPVFH
jgi:hypothetical protein